MKGLEEIGQMGVAEEIQNEKCSSEIGQELMKGSNYLPWSRTRMFQLCILLNVSCMPVYHD